jgi:hypothetical protein
MFEIENEETKRRKQKKKIEILMNDFVFSNKLSYVVEDV